MTRPDDTDSIPATGRGIWVVRQGFRGRERNAHEDFGHEIRHALRLVDVTTGNGGLIAASAYNEPNKWADTDAIPTATFNTFGVVAFVVCGGTGPYAATVIDDPLDGDDGVLPLGVSIPANSTSIVGAASVVLPK